MLAALQVTVVEDAAGAAISTLTGTLIGALLLLAVCVAIWAVWRLNKVQSERVEDKDKMVVELIKAQGAATELTKDLLEKFNKNSGAISQLEDAVRGNTAGQRELSNKIERMDRAVDFLSRGGLSSRYRSTTPPPRTSEGKKA